MNWSDPLNWDSNTLPDLEDVVTIEDAEVLIHGVPTDPVIARLILIKTILIIEQHLSVKNEDGIGIHLSQESFIQQNNLLTIQVNQTGITITGNSNVTIEGDVTIEGVSEGIFATADSELVNEGFIEIKSCQGTGIHALGDFENSGVIEISDNVGLGLWCEGEFENKSMGRLEVATVGIITGARCDTSSVVTNHGYMYFYQASMQVLGQFSNYDTIVHENSSGLRLGSVSDTLNIAKFHNYSSGYFSSSGSGGSAVFIQYPDTLINEGTIVAHDAYIGGIFSRGHFENFDTILCTQMMLGIGIELLHTAINHPTGFISVVDSSTGLSVSNGKYQEYGTMYLAESRRPISNSGQLHIHTGGKIQVEQMSPGEYLLEHYTFSDNYLIVDGELDIK